MPPPRIGPAPGLEARPIHPSALDDGGARRRNEELAFHYRGSSVIAAVGIAAFQAAAACAIVYQLGWWVIIPPVIVAWLMVAAVACLPPLIAGLAGGLLAGVVARREGRDEVDHWVNGLKFTFAKPAAITGAIVGYLAGVGLLISRPPLPAQETILAAVVVVWLIMVLAALPVAFGAAARQRAQAITAPPLTTSPAVAPDSAASVEPPRVALPTLPAGTSGASARLTPEIIALRSAAEAGSATAQHDLGVMHREGRDLPKNDAEAVAWFGRAAEQGFIPSQINLGMMLASGEGVPQDHARALRWFRRAAEAGNASAQYKVGVMYVNGWGVPRDLAEGYKWIKLAAAQNDADAVAALPQVTKQAAIDLARRRGHRNAL